MNAFEKLAEQLVGLAPEVPDEIPVISLDRQDDKVGFATRVAGQWAAALQLDVADTVVERRRTMTKLRYASGGRSTLFHASGAASIRTGISPFAELFDADPGDEALGRLAQEWADKFGLADLLPAGDRLDFERMWRIKAAGADPKEQPSDTVLCRAIGAWRHHVMDLPVLGRASAHVEVTGQGNVAGASLFLRRSAISRDDVLTTVKPRPAEDAAADVAALVARMVGGGRDGELAGEVVPHMFAYGYLSLGRRRAQAVLAPMYVAAISIVGGPDQTRSAHLVPVPGSRDRFLKLPSGSGASAVARAA